ncbi:c-type cytochrome [Parvularcula sp. LCG005]|uniref:c-type cytochrome n=1 Tax=Parvularcula sp. LCG005 TaxID=3078805 RepID=UPI002943B991|nr:c-type cytochrome [Parvularcula sp. LCG005]WOI53203.1 c-type cytochrome [Parvularcula sp. LCG005]
MKLTVHIVGAVIAAIAAFVSAVYLISERKLTQYPQPTEFTADIPSDLKTIEQGRHVARIRGCFGCHGQKLEGRTFTDQWSWVERAVAPNLAAYARDHDVATLERAIRHGIGADDRAFWSMPSYNFVHLSDDDLIAMIAYLRSVPVEASDLPDPILGWKARWLLAVEGEKSLAMWATDVPPLKHQMHENAAIRRGEYLAMTTCNECHGLDLRGKSGDPATPDLAIVASYPEDDFRQLLTTGVGMGGRDNLGLMSLVAPDRFPDLTA